MEAQDISKISIPVIDLSGIESPLERPKIIDQVKHSAKTWGFFQVINHGIPLSVQNDTVSAVTSFHEFPGEAKSKPGNPRGVTYASNTDQFSAASANAAAAGCRRDTLWIMALPDLPPAEEIPGALRKEVSEWVPRAADVAEAIMAVLSEGLGLERGRLGKLSLLGNKVFMGHRYPYCPNPDNMVGLASHTDGGVLTVLMANQRPGLQVMYEGLWLDVKPELGALIVNIGDFFQILSNDEYKSVQHRVLVNTWKEPRISIAMVFNPTKWKDFGPLPELLSPEKPAIYRRFTEEEYMDTFRGKSIGNKSLVERVKIV